MEGVSNFREISFNFEITTTFLSSLLEYPCGSGFFFEPQFTRPTASPLPFFLFTS